MKKGTTVALAVAAVMIVFGGIIALSAYFIGGGNIGFYYQNGELMHNQGSGKMRTDRKEFSGVRAIEVDVDLSRVELRTGAAGSGVVVEYAYPDNLPKPICTQQGDTLVYQSRQKNGNGALFNLPGFNLFGWNDNNQDPYTIITYPAGSEFERAIVKSSFGTIKVNDLAVKGKVEIRADLGRVEVENVTADNLESYMSAGSSRFTNVKANSIQLDSDLGSIKCENLDTAKYSCENSSGSIEISDSRLGDADISADLGRIAANRITTTSMDVNSSSGSVELSGVLGGKTKVDADLGSVRIDTSLPRSQYRLDLNTDLGSVHVDGRQYGTSMAENEGAADSIEVENSSGSVTVNFE